jgi:serine/threonine-protein kinase
VRLHREVSHRSIISLLQTISLPNGLALVYPWVDGEVLYGAPTTGRAARLDPRGAHARFRARPLADVLLAIDSIIDGHLAVANAGFVAVDLYDGCFIYDFDARRMWLCDLDEYRPGPFVLTDERLPGSTRFMAPEEFQKGSSIDQRTTVFNLGRAAAVLLNEGDLDGQHRGPAATARVIERATQQRPENRYPTVAAFAAAWRTSGAH